MNAGLKDHRKVMDYFDRQMAVFMARVEKRVAQEWKTYRGVVDHEKVNEWIQKAVISEA